MFALSTSGEAVSESSFRYGRIPASAYCSIRQVAAMISSGTVLDVGCATGNLGLLLEGKPVTLWGIEADREAAMVTKKHYADVSIGDLDEPFCDPWPAMRFDYIVCADVLEHLIWPEQTLSSLAGKLNPEGRLIVSLPNVANLGIRWRLLLGNFEYEACGILDRTHLHFFTLSSARALLATCGLRIVEERYVPGLDELPAYVTIRSILRRLGWSEASDVGITNLWPGLFAFQFIFLTTRLKG